MTAGASTCRRARRRRSRHGRAFPGKAASSPSPVRRRSPSSRSGMSPRCSSTRLSSASSTARAAVEPTLHRIQSDRRWSTGAAGAALAAPGRRGDLQDHCRGRARPPSGASSITAGSRSPRRCSASLMGTLLGIGLAIAHRPRAEPRPEPDAVGGRLADHPDPGHRADGDRRPRRGRPDRAPAEGDHLDLSLLLPRDRRHGEGAPLARPDPSRPDAHLQRQPRAGVLEAALAVVGAVPLRLDEGGRRREPGRRHRRRDADRRGGRARRAAAHRLLLRPDRADLVGAGRRRADGRACWSASSASSSAWCFTAWAWRAHDRPYRAMAGMRLPLVAFVLFLATPIGSRRAGGLRAGHRALGRSSSSGSSAWPCCFGLAPGSPAGAEELFIGATTAHSSPSRSCRWSNRWRGRRSPCRI